jgi:polysaccharide export outer membrane protein
MIRTLQFLVAALLCLGVAACGRLPAGAPASNELLKEVQEDENGEFALYLVSRAFLPTVQHWPETGQRERLSWIGRSQGPKTQIIQPGDALTLQVWDSSENSLLTAREQRVVPLERVRVAANGTIFVPYVGDVRVSGLTPAVAREKLQSDLEVIVPSVQVQLSMEEGRANSVELVGGVAQPGTYPMPDRNYSVRSLLSAGGGVSPALKNPQIRLVRGSAIYGTSVDKLLATEVP